MLKFAATEGKAEFCPKPKPDQIGICAVTPAKEMTIVEVPKNAALMDAGTFASNHPIRQSTWFPHI